VVVSHEPYFNHEITTHPNGKEITAENAKMFNIYEMTYEDIKLYDVYSSESILRKVGGRKIVKSEPSTFYIKQGEPQVIYNLDEMYGVSKSYSVNTGNKKSSQQYLQEMWTTTEKAEASTVSLSKVIPKTKVQPIIKTAGNKPTTSGLISYQETPSMVGGVGLSVVPYSGTGKYEVSEAIISPSISKGITSNAAIIKLDTRTDSKINTKLETKVDTKLNTILNTKLDTKVDYKLNNNLFVNTRTESKLDSKLDFKLDSKQKKLIKTKILLLIFFIILFFILIMSLVGTRATAYFPNLRLNKSILYFVQVCTKGLTWPK
jgi:hypothetical protein